MVVVASLISPACGSTQPSGALRAKSASTLPFGNVESPRVGETVRGRWPVSGWALSEDGVKAVNIYVDRSYMGTARLGVSRPDVEKAYPAIKDSATAGWTFVLDTMALTPGQHQVVVQVRSVTGGTRDIGQPSFNVSR